MKIQVVGPTDNWVLERLARVLAARIPDAEFSAWKPRAGGAARLAYYVNYALYEGPSGLIDVGFFTHRDDEQQFLERARRMDYCVCMNQLYAEWLREQGVQKVTHIPMGFDAEQYRPRLVLGVFGRLEHPRKGGHLVEEVKGLPFVEIVASDGKVAEEELRELYQRVDYVLIPATVEGGPLALLEGLAMGKPILAPEGVGMVPEFGPSEFIRLYPAGDGAALVRLVTQCYEEKCRPGLLVQDRSWDRWAAAHQELFSRLLSERRKEVRQERGQSTILPPQNKGDSPLGRGGQSPLFPGLSLIVTVLESYETVRRQLLYLERILPADCELILVDDGSVPPLQETCDAVAKHFPFRLHCTGDRRPWTQPRARNIGASLARADKLLFFDIDHILTAELIARCRAYEGDRLQWVRRPGILDENGQLAVDRATLLAHGLNDQGEGVHANSFLIRRAVFEHLGGYDERFCGRYGGDDIDFNERYERLCAQGLIQPVQVQGEGFYYPDPAYLKEQFHTLTRTLR